jgi:addiction module HigA family antidote
MTSGFRREIGWKRSKGIESASTASELTTSSESVSPGPRPAPQTSKSSITIKVMRKVPYPHPGEILLEEFLKPMGITQYRVAKEIGVPQRRISEIIAGTRAVTPDTGLRLSKFFGMSENFWIGLQLDYDSAKAKDLLEGTLTNIRTWPACEPQM